VLHAIITFATEEAGEESSKTLFYVCGGALAAWALILSAIGIRAHATFPSTEGAKRGVIGISLVLTVLAMASAVITG
jgi:hypothetical protein